MRFNYVCNPVWTRKKFAMFKDQINTDKKCIIISGVLFMNGIWNSKDFYNEILSWLSTNFKVSIIIPGYKDLTYNSDPDSSMDLFKSRYDNVIILQNDHVLSSVACIYGGTFMNRDDSSFYKGMESANKVAIENNVPLVIATYNLFSLPKDVSFHVKYQKWIYSAKKTKTVNNNHITNNTYDKNFKPNGTVRILSLNNTKCDNETSKIKDKIQEKIDIIYGGDNIEADEVLTMLCLLKLRIGY